MNLVLLYFGKHAAPTGDPVRGIFINTSPDTWKFLMELRWNCPMFSQKKSFARELKGGKWLICNQSIHAKVLCCLLFLLVHSAFVQTPRTLVTPCESWLIVFDLAGNSFIVRNQSFNVYISVSPSRAWRAKEPLFLARFVKSDLLVKYSTCTHPVTLSAVLPEKCEVPKNFLVQVLSIGQGRPDDNHQGGGT